MTVSLRPQRVLLSLASSQVATQGIANSPVANQAFSPEKRRMKTLWAERELEAGPPGQTQSQKTFLVYALAEQFLLA